MLMASGMFKDPVMGSHHSHREAKPVPQTLSPPRYGWARVLLFLAQFHSCCFDRNIKKKKNGQGRVNLQFQVSVHCYGEVKAGIHVTSHIAARIKEWREINVSMLSACSLRWCSSLLNSSEHRESYHPWQAACINNETHIHTLTGSQNKLNWASLRLSLSSQMLLSGSTLTIEADHHISQL